MLDTLEQQDPKRDMVFVTLSEIFAKQKEVPEKWKKLVIKLLFPSISSNSPDYSYSTPSPCAAY